MTQRFLISGLALVLLSACNAEPQTSDRVTSVDLDQPAADAPPPSPPPPPSLAANAANDGQPDLTPATLTPEAERTEKGARNVLLSFARAIELEEWDQAWAMLDEGSQSQWPRAEWAGMFDDLRDITVAVPNGRMEGAAGSSYYTTDLIITAQDADGRPIRYEGPIVLRRSNDVPGATEAQRRWHIYSLDLSATH
ncbi:hypothetical protein E3U23_06665 [Erythrobacter litoralis]|uniref:hypothetical protein n=1 Tax=Erythrobacter litoralis TaxID=39960 RepID=UPI002435B4E5|nr:hypothetical protein [Erythrobacter litoralis]MDG6078873.1 hypothetical protein [Erythrobacter litoralis]